MIKGRRFGKKISLSAAYVNGISVSDSLDPGRLRVPSARRGRIKIHFYQERAAEFMRQLFVTPPPAKLKSSPRLVRADFAPFIVTTLAAWLGKTLNAIRAFRWLLLQRRHFSSALNSLFMPREFYGEIFIRISRRVLIEFPEFTKFRGTQLTSFERTSS